MAKPSAVQHPGDKSSLRDSIPEALGHASSSQFQLMRMRHCTPLIGLAGVVYPSTEKYELLARYSPQIEST